MKLSVTMVEVTHEGWPILHQKWIKTYRISAITDLMCFNVTGHSRKIEDSFHTCSQRPFWNSPQSSLGTLFVWRLTSPFSQTIVQKRTGWPHFFYSIYLRKIRFLHDISKYEHLFIIQLLNIRFDSLLETDFRRFTESVQMLNSAYYFITFTVTYCYHKNNTDISLLVVALLKKWVSLVQG